MCNIGGPGIRLDNLQVPDWWGRREGGPWPSRPDEHPPPFWSATLPHYCLDIRYIVSGGIEAQGNMILEYPSDSGTTGDVGGIGQ